VEYRCFHCKQVFTDECLARAHFGDTPSGVAECIKMERSGSGGGWHDAFVRVSKAYLIDMAESLRSGALSYDLLIAKLDWLVSGIGKPEPTGKYRIGR